MLTLTFATISNVYKITPSPNLLYWVYLAHYIYLLLHFLLHFVFYLCTAHIKLYLRMTNVGRNVVYLSFRL